MQRTVGTASTQVALSMSSAAIWEMHQRVFFLPELRCSVHGDDSTKVSCKNNLDWCKVDLQKFHKFTEALKVGSGL